MKKLKKKRGLKYYQAGGERDATRVNYSPIGSTKSWEKYPRAISPGQAANTFLNEVVNPFIEFGMTSAFPGAPKIPTRLEGKQAMDYLNAQGIPRARTQKRLASVAGREYSSGATDIPLQNRTGMMDLNKTYGVDPTIRGTSTNTLDRLYKHIGEIEPETGSMGAAYPENFTSKWNWQSLPKPLRGITEIPKTEYPLPYIGSNKMGGVINDNRGQYAHPGKVTRIKSNNITMEGVPYPVLGVDNHNNMQYMEPGGNYIFPGDYVTEYPMGIMGTGGPSPSKAHEMLKDGTAHGKPLTAKQKRYFGMIYGNSKKQRGGAKDTTALRRFNNDIINEFGVTFKKGYVPPQKYDEKGNPIIETPGASIDTGSNEITYYSSLKNAVDTAGFLVDEIPHAMQMRDYGREKFDKRFSDEDKRYNTPEHPYRDHYMPGTIENEAHFGAYRDSIDNRLKGYTNTFPWLMKQMGGGMGDHLSTPPMMMNHGGVPCLECGGKMKYHMGGDQQHNFPDDMSFPDQRKGNFLQWLRDTSYSALENEFNNEGFHVMPDGSVMSNSEMKKGGNWIKGAVNPKHKGYCTPMTKSTCTPRRKAFAMTMKKHHGFHEGGGEYQPGGQYQGAYEPWWDYIPNIGRKQTYTPYQAPQAPQPPQVMQASIGPDVVPEMDPGLQLPMTESSKLTYNWPGKGETTRPKVLDRWWANPDIINTGMETATNVINYFDRRKKEKRLRQTTSADWWNPASPGNRGDYTTNYGYFKPDQMTPVQYPGNAGFYQYKSGGTYYITPEDEKRILAMGGSIEYID